MIYIHFSDVEKLPSLSSNSHYKCIVVAETSIDGETQTDISRWLIESGCLYMMAWGENCSAWDDSVDYANLEKFEFDSIPDEKHVMTTWHDDESLEDVFWFAKNSAYSQYYDLDIVVFHIGEQSREKEFETMYAAV